MYMDVDDASDIEEDFCNAIALLHSSEGNSAEQLRKMLDALIEKKYGYNNTLVARMPEKFVREADISEKISSNRISKKHESTMFLKYENVPLSVNNETKNVTDYINIIDVEFEDYTEKGEIPRISIPDEGSSDGLLLCKICNGAKLGPLILLECQECQEVYHPLCHQPPVVDIDVYDPRIVWRCRKCVETSTTSLAAAPIEKKNQAFRRTIKPKEIYTRMDKFGKTDASYRENEINLNIDDSTDTTQRDESINHVSTVTKNSQKPPKTPSSNQSKKRVGSRLSVTRIPNKQ